jgi:hypothetical protein
MTEGYNKDLCEERHEYLKEWCDGMEASQNKLSNRFIVLLTGLSLNLAGIIILLVIQLARHPDALPIP